MDRRIGVALVAALALALFVIAYLLGRESARTTPAVVVLTPAPVNPTSGGVEAASDPAYAPPPTGLPPAAPVDPGYAAPASTPVVSGSAPMATTAPELPAATSAVDPAVDTSLRAEVSRYFMEVEALQRASKGWTGDANAAAQEILRDAVNGDTRGIQALIDANQTLMQKLRMLETPAPCLPHRQVTVEALEAANRLLVKMRTSIGAQDLSSLGTMSSEGQDVERRAKEADALATDIKKRYGL